MALLRDRLRPWASGWSDDAVRPGRFEADRLTMLYAPLAGPMLAGGALRAVACSTVAVRWRHSGDWGHGGYDGGGGYAGGFDGRYDGGGGGDAGRRLTRSDGCRRRAASAMDPLSDGYTVKAWASWSA